MLKIEKFVTPSTAEWEIVIEGMRNPMNSWHLMDSDYRKIASAKCDECGKYNEHDEGSCDGCELNELECWDFIMGPNDHELTMNLAKGGPVHAKYRRMIPVFVTINAPLYWWKEFDTYKVGTVCNSCSTMHKIHAKEFTMDDFSCEHLVKNYRPVLEETILALNSARDLYLNGGMLDNYNGTARIFEPKDKDAWWQMIQLLPTSYNQKRTVMLNYEVLHNIYISRKNHKLDEWHVFCDWIEELPYSEIIIGERD